MARRSLQLRPEDRDEARAVLKRLGLTQIGLGIQAEIQSPATLSNFFCGKPVDRGNFNKLCRLLGLDPQQVGQEPAQMQASDPPPALNTDLQRSGEESWYRLLLEERNLMRIQAPSQFGKTRLMSRMLCKSEQQGHLTVYLTLNTIDPASFGDSATFFESFICEVANEIEGSSSDLLMPLADYRQKVKDLGCVKATIRYFEQLQQQIPQPFTLGINKLDRLLDNPQNARTAVDFLSLLRAMHERSNINKYWQQFRLILAYSALQFEESLPIVDSQSPFNVGAWIDLREFSPSEVAELAIRKRLTLDTRQIQAVMASIGGIPSLIQLTLNGILERGEDLLEDLESLATLYQNHLEILDDYLSRRDLSQIMHQIATTTVEISALDNNARNSLYRHGLIITRDRQVLPRCELYRRFFTQK
jgi:hypothetical protein